MLSISPFSSRTMARSYWTATLQMKKKKKRPYKLESWCLGFEEVDQIVANSWASLCVGSTLFKVQRKLSAVSTKCKTWCLNFKGKHKIKWDQMNHELTEAQNNIANDSTSLPWADVKIGLRASTDIKLEYWKQRARTSWDELGDQATSFFFKCAKTRQGKNEIRAIKNRNGEWLIEPGDVKKEFVEFYKELFSGNGNLICNEDDFRDWAVNMPQLSASQVDTLLKPFSQNEVKEAMFSMKPNKSPGPDGIPPGALQKLWHIVGDEISQATRNFLEGGYMLKETNKTYIALIPKVDRPVEVSQFRPISLCNSTYKVISKCMVRRLQPLMKHLIGENQNAFVPGRSINDNCIIAHEMLSSVKKKKKGDKYSVILNLDLNKAYDRIKWSFVKEVLKSVGLPNLWIHLIMECITSVSYSVIVNGEPIGQITPKAGLRQGDPLSPYIFILCMEVLSQKLIHNQAQGLIQGLKINRRAPEISHLFFADDALFFLKGTMGNVGNLRTILDKFCDLSGEMINTQKSHTVFSRNTPKKFVRFVG